jgi:hypothetical protein
MSFTMESHRYYSCLFCGGLQVPMFHWEGDTLFEFHKMFMREQELQILETGEVLRPGGSALNLTADE